MILVLAAPIAIFGLVLSVPVAYRYLWPIELERPKPFMVIALGMGLIVAAVAVVWFFAAFIGGGSAGPSRTGGSSAAFEAVVRNRLLVAAVLGALVEYLLCRITHTIMAT
jgi:hypothetical protein